MEETVKKPIRAAIYIRVSTDEQIKGYGLTVQDEKLRAFVKLHDYALDEKHIYTHQTGRQRHVGHSGKVYDYGHY